ncbi:polyprenol reductase [Leptomonas seymouri]|uniref:Polyprenol reductase n=1 Tax=Leptomonas seymouri TaxID=5684 RepID=A0A0N1PF75_LEPSE|nr:polyprenol reductase [Leptomonas seymouri]|eukprot:KPI90020.1 polyprenol reductase [Leptomonas seymouri]
MKVTVVSGKDGARRQEIELSSNATLDDLKAAFRPQMDSNRKSFKISGPAPAEPVAPAADGKKPRPNLITLSGGATLEKQGVKNGMEIIFKDLGPQIGYRTVFLVEYAGPLAFMLLYATRPSFIYGSAAMPSYGYAQKLFIGLFVAHFVKRELESMFVHKFSHPTMPLRNIVKNCSYYWSFAAFIGYVLCHPKYTEPCQLQSNIGAVLMVVNEILNFAVHYQLATMRKGDGDTTRNVPKGPLFAWMSCPNYFFEIASWVSFSVGTNLLSSWLFTLAGFLQMLDWAKKKHRGYVKIDPANKKKACLIPFLL